MHTCTLKVNTAPEMVHNKAAKTVSYNVPAGGGGGGGGLNPFYCTHLALPSIFSNVSENNEFKIYLIISLMVCFSHYMTEVAEKIKQTSNSNLGRLLIVYDLCCREHVELP